MKLAHDRERKESGEGAFRQDLAASGFDVTRGGIYTADFLYTSNRGGTISIDVNGKDATGPLQITTTNDPADSLAWRQWHYWNLAKQLFKLPLNKGKHVLSVRILTLGNMNLAYFDFKSLSTFRAR